MDFNRQELVLGKDAQTTLRKSTVTVIGAGSTGSVAAELLVRAGVGRLIVLDPDVVTKDNLNRQLYQPSDVGAFKVEALKLKLDAFDSEIVVYAKRLNRDTADLVAGDVILDCTDNLFTRFLINDIALKRGMPWVYCGAVGTRGMVYTTTGSPCFRCVFDHVQTFETCDTAGIIAPASAAAASFQVGQAIAVLTGKHPSNALLTFDVLKSSADSLKVSDLTCPACTGTYDYLEGDETCFIRLCTRRQCLTAMTAHTVDAEQLKESYDILSEDEFSTTFDVDGTKVRVYAFGELEFPEEKNEDVVRSIVATLNRCGKTH